MDEAERMAWDQEPRFVSIAIRTWEHAVAAPGSWGIAASLSQSKRLLPPELTNPIYEALARAESLMLRISEPFPPLRVRLLRSDAPDEHDPVFSFRFGDIVSGWDERLKAALGDRYEGAAQAATQAGFSAGLPAGDFSVGYGYGLKVAEYPGAAVEASADTHRSLLMGRHEPWLPPGFTRDAMSALAGGRGSNR